jgi:hypothetical protein
VLTKCGVSWPTIGCARNTEIAVIRPGPSRTMMSGSCAQQRLVRSVQYHRGVPVGTSTWTNPHACPCYQWLGNHSWACHVCSNLAVAPAAPKRQGSSQCHTCSCDLASTPQPKMQGKATVSFATARRLAMYCWWRGPCHHSGCVGGTWVGLTCRNRLKCLPLG